MVSHGTPPVLETCCIDKVPSCNHQLYQVVAYACSSAGRAGMTMPSDSCRVCKDVWMLFNKRNHADAVAFGPR